MSLQLLEDFVNTYDVEEAVEHLDTPAALARWLGERGLAPVRARADARDLEQVHEVREAMRVLLLANNEVEVDVAAAAATLNRAARRVRLGVRFGGHASARAEPEAGGAAGGLGRILAAAADAMATGEWRRLKACRAESCQWAFIDTARNQSRAWCSMEVCGNREKAKRFRERHAAGGH